MAPVLYQETCSQGEQSMASLIHFTDEENCERAIDILAEAEETYHSVPKDCFLVSDAALQLLTDARIRFLVIAPQPRTEEEPNATHP